MNFLQALCLFLGTFSLCIGVLCSLILIVHPSQNYSRLFLDMVFSAGCVGFGVVILLIGIQ